ncbi:hypothetical protein ACFL20_00040 [Spirochaetota bacterium]
MKFYTDRRAFNRRIADRRISDDRDYHGYDRRLRIGDRRKLESRRLFNRGFSYRGVNKIHISLGCNKVTVMALGDMADKFYYK